MNGSTDPDNVWSFARLRSLYSDATISAIGSHHTTGVDDSTRLRQSTSRGT